MGRSPCCDKIGIKKGPWTNEEDQKLIDYIQKHGYGNWRTLPKNAGLQRCGKSCRLRWTNYLRPDIKRGRFSFEEEETIIQLHSVLGNKWSAIAARLPGRTDNEIKNYWNTHIRKRLLRMGIDPVTHSPRLDLLDLSSILNSSFYTESQMNFSRLLGGQSFVNPEILRLATSIISSQSENQNQNQNQNSDFFHQEGEENQVQNQYQPFYNEPELMMNPDVEQFPSNAVVFRDWQHDDNAMVPHLTDDYYVPLPSNCNYDGSDHQTVSNSRFGFGSVLSTPSSSPTPLNSNSTYINNNNNSSCTEDERDSYSISSNMLKFDQIQDILDVNEFM